MSDNRILIVHPEPSACALLTSMLQSKGYPLEELSSDRAAARRLEHGAVDLVLVGVDPADPDALELLLYARRKHPELAVILLFSTPDPDRTREALQRGAASVLRFPLPATQLRAAVDQALKPARPAPAPVTGPAAGNGSWTLLDGALPGPAPAPASNSSSPRADCPVFIGEDQSLRQAIELAETIAPTRAAVLIQGERGTGKSLVARALHQQSQRADGPFIEVDGSAHRGAALEVEFFGHRGIGVAEPRPEASGKIAMARGGTLFVDRVEAMPPDLQFKLLRTLQDQEYEPVGSTQTLRSDVRFIFGTKEDLADLVQRDLFRQDLYYRISVVSLKLPPLRHRGHDIERLAEHFLARFAGLSGKPIEGFTPEAVALLNRHDWPGNVQELEAAVERAVVLCRGPRIDASLLHLAPAPARPNPAAHHTILGPRRPAASPGIRPLKEALEEPEKRIILQALEALNWNRQETARVLDINRTTLYKKMKKYGLLEVDVYEETAWSN